MFQDLTGSGGICYPLLQVLTGGIIPLSDINPFIATFIYSGHFQKVSNFLNESAAFLMNRALI
jgi:hypothetical protein